MGLQMELKPRITTVCQQLLRLAQGKYRRIETSREFVSEAEKALAQDMLQQIEAKLNDSDYFEAVNLEFEDDDEMFSHVTSVETEGDEENWEPDEKKCKPNQIRSDQRLDCELQNFTPAFMLKVTEYADKYGNTAALRKWASLKDKNYLCRFRNYIHSGGTYWQKMNQVNKYVITKFIEARVQFLPVQEYDIRRWGLQKARELKVDFKASTSWVLAWKERFRVVARKITKYITAKNLENAEEIEVDAAVFVHAVRNLISEEEIQPANVYNADQSGFEYEFASKRTLCLKGTRQPYLSVLHANAVSHSYTIMVGMTMDGKLMPEVFICCQEKNGTFGPRVRNSLKVPTNVQLVASKSGKLDKTLMNNWINNCLQPVLSPNSLLLLDSWSGHKDDNLYKGIIHFYANDDHNHLSPI
ncbi:unnamed protein product [Allacma fusca]|uniref:HTH CENPB-type domain-containing protein n=1 Tax=Allacma fusca TaxID=39272 RepID=A0A8J2L8E2_9HEXA|nr:unnamed protein product [Allacma fusca]